MLIRRLHRSLAHLPLRILNHLKAHKVHDFWKRSMKKQRWSMQPTQVSVYWGWRSQKRSMLDAGDEREELSSI
jgi:hypothetical protein